eukprot:g214.t1
MGLMMLGLSSSMTALQSSLEIAKEEIKKMKERCNLVEPDAVQGCAAAAAKAHERLTETFEAWIKAAAAELVTKETLFVLARSSSGTLLLCPLAHRGSSSSCCLRGSARGLDDFELVSLRDSSCTAALLLLALELPPHVMASTAASWAAERVAARVGGARLRRERLLITQDFLRFYREFYETLASAGVAGVKCDGQFLAEVLVGPSGAQELAAAQEKALAAFGPSDVPVISCMSMTLPMVHGGSAVLARVSDDHAYPGVPEDAASVARSDQVCPCLHAGLPIDRQIFQDPTVNRRPWWLLNSTAGGFMAAAFGLPLEPHGQPAGPMDGSRRAACAAALCGPAASLEASRGGSKEPKSEPKAEPKRLEQIKKIFGRFDLNGNGTIEVEELAVVFQVLAPRHWSQKAIKRLFDGMDLDEDGKVCFSEFIEWIFDTGTNSFKGALEIAETMDGAKTLEWSVADCKEPLALPNLRIELGILQKLETLPVVPHPIRRVLEAVYMLLLPSSGLPSINALTPPDYAARRFFSIEKVDKDLGESLG